MKIPPKRSKKVQEKLQELSAIKVGKYFPIDGQPSEWRHAILLHEKENKTKFTTRADSDGYNIWRAK